MQADRTGMSQRTAVFQGGPFAAREVPESVVPWSLFVPREPGDNSPPQTLTREDVESQPHYCLVGLTADRKTYRWVPR